MNEKIVVEPFNDIYTHDCFMNAMLCAAKHYKLNYPILTLHSNFYYSFDKGNLCGHRKILFPITELALAIGLKMEKSNDDINAWKEQYHMQLNRNNLIIALLNDYYNPLRLDVYGKEHLPHNILIYDMDDRRKKLFVVESRYRTTVLYKNMEMSYCDFQKSHFQTEKKYKYICEKCKSINKSPYKDEYLRSCITTTEKSIVNIVDYVSFLMLNNIKDINEWLKNIDDICNQLKVEQYIFEKVFNNEDISSVVAHIYQIWYLLRAKILRLLMCYRLENIECNIVNYLQEINKLESDKLNILRSYIL